MLCPKVFKSEDIGFGNGAAKRDNKGGVIKDGSIQGLDLGRRVCPAPALRTEDPV